MFVFPDGQVLLDPFDNMATGSKGGIAVWCGDVNSDDKVTNGMGASGMRDGNRGCFTPLIVHFGNNFFKDRARKLWEALVINAGNGFTQVLIAHRAQKGTGAAVFWTDQVGRGAVPGPVEWLRGQDVVRASHHMLFHDCFVHDCFVCDCFVHEWSVLAAAYRRDDGQVLVRGKASSSRRKAVLVAMRQAASWEAISGK